MALISAIYGNNTFSQKKQNRKKRKFEARLASKKAEYYARELSGRATDAEIKLQHILVDLRIQYVFQKVFMTSNKDFRIVDFWLPQLQTVIEVDGGHNIYSLLNKKHWRKTIVVKQYLIKEGI